MSGLLEAPYMDEVFGENTLSRLRGPRGLKEERIDQELLEQIRRYHNPRGEPTGHYTGRCSYCHSSDLYVEMAVYGCNICLSVFNAGHLPPRIVMNGGAPEPDDIRLHNRTLDLLLEMDQRRSQR